MKNPLIQLGIIAAVLIISWQALRQVDWLTLFRVEQATQNTEEKLGDLLWEYNSTLEIELKSDSALAPLKKIVFLICEHNNIDSSEIKLHLLQNSEVNAFAMPDDHLVIYTGLIANCQNAEELSGVIGHELGHLVENHVMKKLIKEIGLSILISMTTGNGGGEIIQETFGALTSKAYDRDLEREADTLSVGYLLNANINPAPFGEFLFRLAQGHENDLDALYWLSTHPHSEERAANVFKFIENEEHPKDTLMSPSDWKQYQNYIAHEQ